MVIKNDLEQPMCSYYVIYFEKFRKIILQTEKEFLTSERCNNMTSKTILI